MNKETNDILLHYGVKGMRWGVRKSRNSQSKSTGAIKSRINSIKRENSWKKEVKNASKLSDEQIKKLTERIRLENDLKRLGPKNEYLSRDRVDTETLKKRVARLQLEDNLKQQVGKARAGQVELGKEVVNSVALIGVKTMVAKQAAVPVIGLEIAKSAGKHWRKGHQSMLTDKTKSEVKNIVKKSKDSKG